MSEAGGLAAADIGPRQPPTHLLYLHGFRSSPKSFKAQRLLGWLSANRPALTAWCPQLPPSPRAAAELIDQGTAGWPVDRSVVVGSSLGGFYATWMAERRGWAGAVINPAVDPARDLAAYIGEQTAFHDPAERFFFRAEFVDELRTLTLPALSRPQALMALISTGDEVLDWREMAARYHGATLRVIEGSDHALSDFDTHMPHLLQFLKLCD